MSDATDLRIRPLDELDLTAVTTIDEKISGQYRPDQWEDRVTYYLRRDPEACLVAEADGKVVGFMLSEVRGGEFGIEETSGWIGVLGVDPEHRGHHVGRRLGEATLDYFRARGIKTMRTLVDERREDLTRFFATLGFAPSALRPFERSL